MKLYVYDHCPFCVKARMIFGLKKVPVTVEFVLNDDEATPVSMIGKKMTPILEIEPGNYLPESLDIIHFIDQSKTPKLLTGERNPAITQWLEKTGEAIYGLAVPRFAQADLAEFSTREARRYFTENKEAMFGNFQLLMESSEALIRITEQYLLELDKLIKSPSACNGELSEDDFHLFAALRSLSITRGVKIPQGVKSYMEQMSQLSLVPLYHDIAI
ncbi:glutaredoxin 2 [Cellvibrio polysaccharolyticus]|uniref:Glutaredoxin 2 n=1 Tax=Cellvibrio polysaccharolyticus TaxID=2082724 RepID=A0A928V1X3_9GAMM|nr:glutaredoxin 2 [Cellvibrio polysaccharolyticus]MBE8717263.1 glutaredoxin 2 [Cellvibrio polysaccharolyticus]